MIDFLSVQNDSIKSAVRALTAPRDCSYQWRTAW
jgi:hypothetical protein